ncbi:protein RGF1 INDUCIBLE TRANSCRIPTION FACTOR 1-like [Lathyrus oleraceus]|uniref:protein RGF1 INDUCIBLE TRANSCRIPTION FACTOR 1-like n=1 Tax=Pisum sativum TaxID=3888 RepID=UPI0021D0BACD|nr:protein RGF1 INDUCIBLE TRANSCRIPTION FACTOR 1-like [Pisum sativum]
MDMMYVPWLEKLLSITTFFRVCDVHLSKVKNECNMFCIDCIDNPYCGSCITSHHNDHRVIQIRRSSYNEAVKTSDIYKLVDILGIQTYMVNSRAVVFINKREFGQLKRNKIGYMSHSLCKICKRSLIDPTYFCSLACKFESIKKDGGFFISAKDMEEMKRLLEKSIKETPQNEKSNKSRKQYLKRKLEEAGIDEEHDKEEEEKELEEENKKEVKEEDHNKESVVPINPPSASKRKPNSRRKGIPHRAPFF